MKKIAIIIAALLIIPSVSMAGDFHLTQKQDFVRSLQEFSKTLTEIRSQASAMTLAWYGAAYQDSADYDLVVANFTGTDLEGLTEDEIENVIGSLEALETFFTTHATNFEKIAK